jgi:endogenous inhibitor of DNA gyrase (YacG/DUF329 family)
MTDLRNCPICKRPLLTGEYGARVRPFCSKRCADVDLGRWLDGGYAIPAIDSEDEAEDDSDSDEVTNGSLPRH